jgi:calcineurin-like phosphoesterase family protein
MYNSWFISDTHWNHSNVLTFETNGVKVRPGFENVEHMNETMIDNWNKLVKPEDHVYHLGDVIFGHNTKFASILSRLNGRKRLIVGNHDNLTDTNLTKHFEKIMLWRLFKDHNFLVSHIPIHAQEIRKVDFNCHGHIHEKDDPSDRHHNICVEKTNYAPLHLDELVKRLRVK